MKVRNSKKTTQSNINEMTVKSAKKSRKTSRKSLAVLLVLIIVSAGCIYEANSMYADKSRLEAQAAELQAQITQAEKEHDKLVEREEYMKTPEYVEDVARQQLGLVYPDEIIIRPGD